MVLLVLALPGCRAMDVRTTTYLSRELVFPAPATGAKIAVNVQSDPDEPLLEDEVRRKLEHLLAEHGYESRPLAESDYVLFAFFSIDSGNTATGARPVHSPGGIATTDVYSSTGQWATATTYYPGSTSYVPYSYTYFTRFLGLGLFDKDRWLAAGEDETERALVWRASTVSAGRDTDLRSVIDYLLVSTFEHFGEDTGKQVRERVRPGDDRVEALREAVR